MGTLTVSVGTLTVSMGTLTVSMGTLTVFMGTLTVLMGTLTVSMGTMTVCMVTLTVWWGASRLVVCWVIWVDIVSGPLLLGLRVIRVMRETRVIMIISPRLIWIDTFVRPYGYQSYLVH
jgi:hypothetical protein